MLSSTLIAVGALFFCSFVPDVGIPGIIFLATYVIKLKDEGINVQAKQIAAASALFLCRLIVEQVGPARKVAAICILLHKITYLRIAAVDFIFRKARCAVAKNKREANS